MDATKLSNWIQIAATVGILVGIALVVMELRQAKSLAAAQSISEFFTDRGEDLRALMGEDPAQSILKVCQNAPDLTERDLMIVEAGFELRISEIIAFVLVNGVADFGAEWEPNARDSLRSRILSTPHGRWYWNNRLRGALEDFPELRDMGDEILTSGTHEQNKCDLYTDWRAAMRGSN